MLLGRARNRRPRPRAQRRRGKNPPRQRRDNHPSWSRLKVACCASRCVYAWLTPMVDGTVCTCVWRRLCVGWVRGFACSLSGWVVRRAAPTCRCACSCCHASRDGRWVVWRHARLSRWHVHEADPHQPRQDARVARVCRYGRCWLPDNGPVSHVLLVCALCWQHALAFRLRGAQRGFEAIA